MAASAAGTAYQTSLLTEKLAGNLPDIVNPQDVLSPTLSTDGITQSLSPYLAKGVPYKQDYWLPNILASYIPTIGAQKGQVFALPNEADAVVVYYNKDEFKKAGVPLPTDNWTWSQMMADAAKLKVAKGSTQTQWGICDTPDWQALYNPLMKAFGVTSLSETKADLSSPGALKAWQMLVEPTQNGEAVPYATYLSASGELLHALRLGPGRDVLRRPRQPADGTDRDPGQVQLGRRADAVRAGRERPDPAHRRREHRLGPVQPGQGRHQRHGLLQVTCSRRPASRSRRRPTVSSRPSPRR